MHAASSNATAEAGSTTDLGTASTPVPALFTSGFNLKAGDLAGTTPQGTALVATLTRQLQALQAQTADGDPPNQDLLKKLTKTVDALAALISAPLTPATTAVAAPSTSAPLAPVGADAQPTDLAAQFLAAVPSATSPGDASSQTLAATPAQPLPGIAALAAKLADFSQTIATSSPDLAKKLDALTQQLNGAEADPTMLASLTSATDSAGTSLDKIVQSLLAAKPAPAQGTASIPQPQLATPTPPQPPTGGILTNSATAPGTAWTPSTKTASPDKTAPASSSSDTQKSDAQLVAAATTTADGKSDASNTSAPATAAVPAGTLAATTTPRALPAAYQTVSNPINMAQVAYEMVRQASQGSSHFSIRLDPAELGRVDVKMRVDATGAVSARLTVDRSETLDMFQRDRGSLEKALSQAGLDAGKTNLEFSLRQNPFAGLTGGDQRPSQGNSSPRYQTTDEDDSVAPVPSVTLYRGTVSAGGVNLFV